ncbi:hypothetical protein A3C23_00915 [Candidatus Roizmanbacteria bacterium RIFCSPHIGHO2_02_FULL_37_13b]|uniref:Uncharacterized protein n=1 Tax=Candidatus Roizmanbacteria bacterium RIFCSPLOWO2_02_FULL_36_11 TaxID=1802071 RepID=A0A1F7JIV3_9BACT|nr:MAG: hypothetical protein A3C23_00915 [Candidatus Roizmanbacteria bacterium RIFCSPHIGHO2_02_FULL_37_13b]OGK55544.1 MAG: hypothetical protein A3H78_05270 [Candidatus Roizmanbacteria bacterium RIFCSPLOWO2_02_FULL_36_11]
MTPPVEIETKTPPRVAGQATRVGGESLLLVDGMVIDSAPLIGTDSVRSDCNPSFVAPYTTTDSAASAKLLEPTSATTMSVAPIIFQNADKVVYSNTAENGDWTYKPKPDTIIHTHNNGGDETHDDGGQDVAWDP